MQKEDLNFFKGWFLDYVYRFSSADSLIQDNINMKIEHTGKVCENILLIAKSEKVKEEGCRLAETLALFHDLGRFEQFMKYKTFKDSESENHAVLGISILKGEGVLSRLSRIERNLVIKAVEYANEIGAQTLAITGYDGGKLKPMALHSFHVPSFDMQLCGDVHLMFGHMVMKYLCSHSIS